MTIIAITIPIIIPVWLSITTSVSLLIGISIFMQDLEDGSYISLPFIQDIHIFCEF